MSIEDRALGLAIAVCLIFIGYQIYFFPQRFDRRKYYHLFLEVDDLIPFRPSWVWIYTVAYYPFILSLVFLVSSWSEYAFVASSFFFMLILQAKFALVFPVRTPRHWREYNSASISRKLLRFVQSIDGGGNCFPSMHVSVAVLSAIHMQMICEPGAVFSALIWLFPILVSLSTVYTKQHYVLDIPGGVLHACFSMLAFYWLAPTYFSIG